MTDFSSIDTPSTVIDTDAGPSAAGGGAPSLSEPAEPKGDAPLSLRAELEAAFKEDQKPEPKADPVPKDEKPAEPKPDEAKPDAKPAKVDEPAKEPQPAPEGDKQPEPKQDDKPESNFKEPPKRFLADSREAWRNVPRAVRRDIEAWHAEHEQDQQRYREVSDRYDRVREFDDLARSNGRDLRESLTQVAQFEDMMRQNPVAALNMALMQVGPRKADGQPVSLYELAQHVIQQGPEGYQQMMARAQQAQQQPQEDPRVGQLQQELQQIKVQQLATQVIEPFKAAHPRYDELQDDIALFLQSGKIPATLSLQERLAAAYDMAERVNPPSRDYQPAPIQQDGPGQERRADLDFSGSKSIKSSPGSVSEDFEDNAPEGESIRDSLRKAHKAMRP